MWYDITTHGKPHSLNCLWLENKLNCVHLTHRCIHDMNAFTLVRSKILFDQNMCRIIIHIKAIFFRISIHTCHCPITCSLLLQKNQTKSHRRTTQSRFLSLSFSPSPPCTEEQALIEIRFILRVKCWREQEKNKSNILNMQFTLWRLFHLAWARLHIKLCSLSPNHRRSTKYECVEECVCVFVDLSFEYFWADLLAINWIGFEEAFCFNFIVSFALLKHKRTHIHILSIEINIMWKKNCQPVLFCRASLSLSLFDHCNFYSYAVTWISLH